MAIANMATANMAMANMATANMAIANMAITDVTGYSTFFFYPGRSDLCMTNKSASNLTHSTIKNI